MILTREDTRVTVSVPHPDHPGPIEGRQFYVSLPDGSRSHCHTLSQAVNRWLNLGRHNSRIGCAVRIDGRILRCDFDGTSWGAWE